MLEMQRTTIEVNSKYKFGCKKIHGDCPVNKRVDDSFCTHEKYCNHKFKLEYIKHTSKESRSLQEIADSYKGVNAKIDDKDLEEKSTKQSLLF